MQILNPKNLKAHLERFHPDIYKVITSLSVFVFNPLKIEEEDNMINLSISAPTPPELG